MSFWRNPEFVRHVRAELRPARALSAAALALVICSLVGLSAWGNTEQNQTREFFKVFYLWVMGIQYVVLLFWCASACGHSIARERELKTYDFLRTTRLTAWELIVGKVLGVPILAYFTIGCALPVAIMLGILAGYALHVLIWTYSLLLVTALFVSLMSLWASMQLEGSSARLIGLAAIIPVALGFGFGELPFPGFRAVSIFPALFTLYGVRTAWMIVPTLFGQRVSFVAVTLVLYSLFGAWLVLMLVRNIKKDTEQIRLLSRWQAIGFSAFINLLFFAFLDPNQISSKALRFGSTRAGYMTAAEIATFMMALNGFILLVIGVAMLSPQEKLKVWWRSHAAGEESYISESGPPWPWLIPSALIAYVLLAIEALGLRASVPLGDWKLGTTAIAMLVFLVFATRDVLFLQWAILTRMKRPVVKGLLYLWLYYSAAAIIAAVFGIISERQGKFLLGLLTPFRTLDYSGIQPNISPGIYLGLALQLLVILLLLRVMSVRLRRPAMVPALSEG